MGRVLRGEIYWADLDPAGRRPILVISHDVFNERSGTVIAMALTGRPPRASFPLTLELDNPELPKKSWVKISQVRTLSVERLGKKITRIAPERLALLMEGLNEIIGD